MEKNLDRLLEGQQVKGSGDLGDYDPRLSENFEQAHEHEQSEVNAGPVNELMFIFENEDAFFTKLDALNMGKEHGATVEKRVASFLEQYPTLKSKWEEMATFKVAIESLLRDVTNNHSEDMQKLLAEFEKARAVFAEEAVPFAKEFHDVIRLEPVNTVETPAA